MMALLMIDILPATLNAQDIPLVIALFHEMIVPDLGPQVLSWDLRLLTAEISIQCTVPRNDSAKSLKVMQPTSTDKVGTPQIIFLDLKAQVIIVLHQEIRQCIHRARYTQTIANPEDPCVK